VLAAALAAFGLNMGSPRAVAQNPMAGHVMQTRDEIPPEQLPAPQKLAGIGNAHIKITANEEAQMWFDQGLNLFHDFWDYESVRAFVQGTRVDPNCAMCYWGIYHAELFTHSNAKFYAKQALAKAVSLKKQVSEAERLYIEASEKGEKESGKAHASGAAKTYRKLVKKYPNDLQARIFLAESIIDGYDANGQPNPGQKESVAILQGVLKEDPDNSAANHYWIHAVEASDHPEQALHSAEILGSLAPTSGHMVHMPGHIFYRVGDYAHAEGSFSASTQADENYMDGQHVEVDNDWNYVHNLMYAIANLMEAGQLEKAVTLSAKLNRAHGQLENSLYPWSTRDSISRIDPKLPVALRSADWATATQLLQGSAVPDTLPNIQFLQRELQRFAAGMQALEQHSVAAAESAATEFDAELKKTSARIDAEAKEKNKKKNEGNSGPPKLPILPDAYAAVLVKNLSIMSQELRAGILLEKKETAKAKELYAQAAQAEKELGYHEPPAYIRPVGETEAAAFMTVADWTDAKTAYEGALAERPKSGFPLYGIALVSEKSGDAAGAQKAYGEFLDAWKSADASLPQLTHAKDYVAAHGTSAGSGK
jgi:hypothetical protein